ncbi:pyridoxal 5'-phosphate synthase glutaminase subunit PdxT [Nocardioides panacis]|uniref:Pyridoxal 5'-phosphate synthase subunit PdxT n=1 Tax=Nocardioides panacis TaxID=2849501 RepID=A0A975T0W5_9ACTN|nr:pyridoxal 5'-phosphate synthase glutaminase subunit PdxT [Nocardioides panacis]QWZ09372.1 pyridoxal 5'-phosphate synthase glutaminase subunit PdxT [Nocardioides panacis]
MSTPVIGVFALQGDVREHLTMLERSGARAVKVRRPTELDALDGIVVPGGESTTMDKLARAFDLFDPLRAALRDGLPAFGTCAGMIMLADRIEGGTADQETLGGLDVVVRRNAFGRQVDSFEADLDVEGLDEGFHAMFIRAPWVEKVGRDVRVVATVSSGAAMGRIVAVRQANLLATSFHPEITGDHRFHQLFVDQVRGAGTRAPR